MIRQSSQKCLAPTPSFPPKETHLKWRPCHPWKYEYSCYLWAGCVSRSLSGKALHLVQREFNVLEQELSRIHQNSSRMCSSWLWKLILFFLGQATVDFFLLACTSATTISVAKRFFLAMNVSVVHRTIFFVAIMQPLSWLWPSNTVNNGEQAVN